jgi:hypothetical protein
VSACGTNKCAYTCNSGYTMQSGTCKQQTAYQSNTFMIAGGTKIANLNNPINANYFDQADI